MSILYSHRLKSVLQHMVSDLGLTLSVEDTGARIDLTGNKAVIEETAARMNVGVEFHESGTGTLVVFRPVVQI